MNMHYTLFLICFVSYTARTYHHCDDFILPSPKSSVYSFLKKVLTLGRQTESASADALSAQLREHSIQLHLDRMTSKLVSFATGVEVHGDQLISHIVLACHQVNDHWVIANVDRRQKIKPAAFGQADIEKVIVLRAHLQ